MSSVLFPVKTHLEPGEVETGLQAVIRDGLTTQAMLTLIGGAFLTDFALRLGASNFVIGVIAALGPLSQLIQVPSIALVERFRNRRAMTVYSVVVARTALLGLAVIPFLSAPGAGLALLLGCLAVTSVFAAVGSCSWNSWMRDLIPVERLGGFFGRRMALATVLGIVCSLAGGVFIDLWKRAQPARVLEGYTWLFLAGTLAGLLGVYFISTIPEPALHAVSGRRHPWEALALPFGDGNFRRLLAFMGSWNFAVNLALPFFAVYMLTTLGLALSTVIALSVGYQVVYFLCLPLWGRYADRFGHKAVLSLNGALFLLCFVAWVFTALPGRHFLTLPLLALLHGLLGIAASGVTLGTNTLGLKLAPHGEATPYLAAVSVVNALAAGLAPLLGGKLADAFSHLDLSWTWRWAGGLSPGRTLSVHSWDLLFLLAAALGLYGLHRLALVTESGEVDARLMLRELDLELRNRRFWGLAPLGLTRLIYFFPATVAQYLQANARPKPQPAQRKGK
jgi:MFS family permease